MCTQSSAQGHTLTGRQTFVSKYQYVWHTHTKSYSPTGCPLQHVPWSPAPSFPALNFTRAIVSELHMSNSEFAGAVCSLTVFAQYLKFWSMGESIGFKSAEWISANCGIFQVLLPLSLSSSILLSEWPLTICIHESDPAPTLSVVTVWCDTWYT